MASFILTFRLESNDTYSQRYDSFVKKLNELVTYRHWDETSSLYIFELDSTADQVSHDLWVGSEFNSTTDIMVVIDVTNRVKSTKGELEYPNLLTSYLGF